MALSSNLSKAAYISAGLTVARTLLGLQQHGSPMYVRLQPDLEKEGFDLAVPTTR
jgi:hypothetical protein